jgi:hypothetical protein
MAPRCPTLSRRLTLDTLSIDTVVTISRCGELEPRGRNPGDHCVGFTGNSG